MDAKLVVIGGKANMGEVKLRLPMTIGRGSKADLIISHPTVSREHCKLSEVNGELLVVDNGSSNGTFVDGEKIESPTIVRSGQILAIGPLTFRAEYEAQQAPKKRKPPQPHESGLAETQAVDRSEFDIDFILDDTPAPSLDKTIPAPKKKPSAPTVEAKAPTAGKPDAGKKAAQSPAPDAKKPAAKAPAAPAKEPSKGKAPVAPKGPETEEMDLDFLLDDVAEEKKKAPAGRDTDQMELDDFDLGAETPKSPNADELTADFKAATVDKTVSFTADELDLGDEFFAEPKAEEKPAEKAPEKTKATPVAPADETPVAKTPAIPEPKAPKIEPPASKEPAAKETPATRPKKAGAMDFDFLAAGPSVEAAPAKKEVSFDDIAADFDFSGKSEAKKSESFEPPKVEEPVAEAAAPAAPVEAEPEAISFDDILLPAEDVVAEEPAAPPAVKDDQKVFDDFLDDAMAESSTPAAADGAVAETAPFEAREEELVWDKSPSPEELALDDQLVEEALAKPETAAQAEAAAPAEVEEFPFSEPIAPPRASELPAMPELAEAEVQAAAEAKPSEGFELEEAPFHEAADAAAVAPPQPTESFEFEAAPAEVPMFDSASESMTLDDAIAAETPTPPTAAASESPAWEPVAPAAEKQTTAADDFDFLSELDDAPAAEAEPSPAVEATPTAGDLSDVALDLDEVPAAPAPTVDLSAMNETQDIDLGAPAAEDVTVAFTSASPEAATSDGADIKAADPASAAAADEFDFLGDDQPAAAAEPSIASESAERNPFADFAPAAGSVAPVFGESEVDTPPASEFAGGLAAADSITPAPRSSKPVAKPAAKLSLLDKIKMLFSGGAKAKPSKAKKPAAPADSPAAKRPIGAPRTVQSLDPIPLDDGPIALSPTTPVPTDAAPASGDEMPSFDFDVPAVDVASPCSTPSISPSIAEAGSGFPLVDSGWKSSEASIPLDDGPISFDFDAPATPPVEPAAEPTAEAPAPTTAPAADASVTTEVAADKAAASDEFDLFGEDFLDASANPEAAAAQAFAVESPSPSSTEPAAESTVEQSVAPLEQPTAEQPIAEEAFWFDDVVADPAAESAADSEPKAEMPWSDAPALPAAPESITTPEAASTDQSNTDDEFPNFDLDSASEQPVASTEPEAAPLGLADDLSLIESAPTTEAWSAEAPSENAPVAEDPIAEVPIAEERIVEEPVAEAPVTEAPVAEEPVAEGPDVESLLAEGLVAEGPVAEEPLELDFLSNLAPSETPAAEVSAATDDVWSFDEPEGTAAAMDAATADSPAPEASTAAEAEFSEAPAVPAPPVAFPTPPVSSRARSIDVDLRLSSSLRPLTRISMRPPKIDVAAMEPEAPSGRSFEPRPKTAAAPAPAVDAPTAEASTAEGPAAEASAVEPPASETASSASDDLDLDFGAYDAPAETPQAETPQSDSAQGESAFTESSSTSTDDFSFLDDAPAAPATRESDDGRTLFDKTPDEADRTVAYLGSPKVVEEAESFLADLDDKARTAPEPSFDLDAMLADADRAQPSEGVPPAASEAADAGDELSFLTLTDDVAEAAPSAVPDAPEAKADEPAAHVPSAEVDLGFLDLVDVTEAPGDFQDFGFDDPKPETRKPVEPKADSAKPDGKTEGAKNGAKSSPQPAAAAPKGVDEDLDDFLRDLGMN